MFSHCNALVQTTIGFLKPCRTGSPVYHMRSVCGGCTQAIEKRSCLYEMKLAWRNEPVLQTGLLDKQFNGDDDGGNARERELAGRGKGLRLPSIIPTIQPLSVFLAKGNFIPRDFYENCMLSIILLCSIIQTIQPLLSSCQKETSHQRILLKKLHFECHPVVFHYFSDFRHSSQCFLNLYQFSCSTINLFIIQSA